MKRLVGEILILREKDCRARLPWETIRIQDEFGRHIGMKSGAFLAYLERQYNVAYGDEGVIIYT